ncbi:MAG TPA: hypothetical protein PKD88_11050 [Nitrosomonas sp.]|nr:hypothetical protein [Nitrosomonas sp.]HMW21530.1 hypothetical protein [Nitrosomonas sp.]HMW69186.1 hypothetical protein [Nitrosomonas sp.]HMY62358.1 hypothetical protein [Nitrosomonas sp.]HND37313.1 hypothetical protein [Nitrosomonas sp.]
MRRLAEMLEIFLKKCFPTRVTFDDGSYIEHLNYEAILYAEKDGHQMEVVWYFNSHFGSARLLYADDIDYWNSPYELETLSDQKKKEIQQKIVSYCQKRKISIEIIPVGSKPPSL